MADYNFVFVAAKNACGTHYATGFQASSLHRFVLDINLPLWAIINCYNVYQNYLNVITTYSGGQLTQDMDSINIYHLSCLMVVLHSIGIILNRFGIFWSMTRVGLSQATRTIFVACKLHNFITEHSVGNEFCNVSVNDFNDVHDIPRVYVQN